MKSIGIDLGTAGTRIFVKGKGIVLREPSAVTVSDSTEEVLAVGLDASRMAGRTPDDVSVRRPIKAGVIAQFDAAVAMTDVFLQKAVGSLTLHHPQVMVAVPYSVNDVERRAVEEVILEAGAKSVALIESSLTSAIGAGLRVTHPKGSMIVDIGGGTTEIAVMSLGGIVVARSVRVAGDTLDEAICALVRKKYNVMISETTAEYCKRSIGYVKCPGDPAHPAKEMEIRGRNVITGLPVTLRISADDMAEAMAEPVSQIVEAIRATLENTPPELAADLLEDGILLSGGGALLGGLAPLIGRTTHLKVSIAKNPTDCSVLGLGRLLEYTGDVDRIIRFRSK
ncbi:MAG: rod shape-determining protein [Clostridia bacterium]|nr:rod shape-determining protein [Clostridia bacterium]